jgi:hypothetical protein
LMASGVTAIAYETVTSQQGTLPLLMPMSEVAGRMAPRCAVLPLPRPPDTAAASFLFRRAQHCDLFDRHRLARLRHAQASAGG